MTRKHDEPTVSRHIEVFKSDWDFLQAHFGRGSEERLGVSNAIRQMIRRGVKNYQAVLVRRQETLAPRTTAPLPALNKFFNGVSPTPNTEEGGFFDDDEGIEVTPAAMAQLRETFEPSGPQTDPDLQQRILTERPHGK